MIEKILQIAAMANTLINSEAGKAVLNSLANQQQLTAEQRANLDANYADYVERIRRLRGEIGDTHQD